MIDDLTCAHFLAELAQRPGLRGAPRLSPNTVIKHAAHLQFCLDKAGPRSRLNRLGQNLLAEPPFLARPPRRRKPPRDRFTLDELTAWLDCLPATAQLPRRMRGAEPARWWRALILFAYNTALRINAVCEARRGWLETRHPKRGALTEWWLLLPADVMKGRREGQEVYLNTAARLALQMAPPSEDGRLFAWPGWPESQGWLQELRRRQLAEALPPGRRFGFHGLRKAALHWLASKNPLVARKVAGHVDGSDVLSDHYTGADVVMELLERLPQPGPAHQKRLPLAD
jgi:integrase